MTRRQRALLLFVSASGYTAWFSGLGEGTDAAEFARSPVPAVTMEMPAAQPQVAALIERDPFSIHRNEMPATRNDLPANIAADRPAEGPSVPVLADRVVVPNIETAGTPPAATSTFTLRATIVGPNPVAYVANGSATDIVRVGDTLADRRIATIDLRGIVFSDGVRLDLPQTYEATPRPHSPALETSVRISIASLRRLLLPLQRAASTAAPRSAEVPLSRPEPAPTAAYPTPGPLPTVDMRGLPVGVNPTPDPNAPTPYPYPYPYAPPVPH